MALFMSPLVTYLKKTESISLVKSAAVLILERLYLQLGKAFIFFIFSLIFILLVFLWWFAKTKNMS